MEDTRSGRASTTRHRDQCYIYEPLQYREGEIRLLKILPGARPSCTIEHFLLQSAPRYKAVSYRWGTGPLFKEILMNNYPIKISDNLFDFLSQRASILWIDQLCIDQSSISEKNHQVAQMGAIYSKALQILVWLGNGT
ncbi:HET-domain-containing protein, partial [Karstenula rhodostoma CBS 690.94]